MWVISAWPFGRISLLSKMLTRMASGAKLPGIVQAIVGVSPAPDMVTFTGYGTGVSVPASDGPATVTAASFGRSKRRSHGCAVRLTANGVAFAQKFGFTANGTTRALWIDEAGGGITRAERCAERTPNDGCTVLQYISLADADVVRSTRVAEHIDRAVHERNGRCFRRHDYAQGKQESRQTKKIGTGCLRHASVCTYSTSTSPTSCNGLSGWH